MLCNFEYTVFTLKFRTLKNNNFFQMVKIQEYKKIILILTKKLVKIQEFSEFVSQKMHPRMLIAWLADGVNLVSGNLMDRSIILC